MWAKELRRMVNPAILARRGIAWIKRIIDAVVFLVGLAHHQQTNLLLGVLEKSVADTGTRGKTSDLPVGTGRFSAEYGIGCPFSSFPQTISFFSEKLPQEPGPVGP